jgi:hypothetical protein
MKQKRGIFCCDEAKSWLWSQMSTVSPGLIFFYFQTNRFCFSEAKAGNFLLRRSKVMVLAKTDTCHAEKPEAGRFWASGGLSAGPLIES